MYKTSVDLAVITINILCILVKNFNCKETFYVIIAKSLSFLPLVQLPLILH